MKRKSFFRKFLACAAGTATMISCIAAGTVANVPITAAADSNYAEALKLSLYFYDANQCGSEVEDNPLTWRSNCHTYDGEADLNSAVGLSSSAKSFIMNANGGSSKVDVSGGYHDAGDHIKFTKTMGFSMTSLAWSYFSYPQAYESTGSKEHLMYILKNNADYFMKVTYLDGNDVVAYCYQVASEGEDHSNWAPPEDQKMNRTTYWAEPSHPDGCSAGLMSSCLSATSLVFKDAAPDYAAECLKYAKALEAFANKYPQPAIDGYGGMYQNSNDSNDERAFAELWRVLAENNGKLPASYNPTYKRTGNGCYNNSIYDYDKYTWDKLWSGYAALLTECGYDTNTYIEEMKFEINNQGGLSSSSYNGNGWGASRYNCSLQMLATHIGKAANDNSYYEAAKYQMDYLLGNNPTGYSFIVGYGNKWPTHIHHRAANPGEGDPEKNTEAKHTLYGALIGGPDSSGNYQDHENSYQFTEPALDYNGCFALAIAPLVEKYGGDVSVADSVIKNASEIDENFNFNIWGGNPEPTEPTTEPTEPVTEPTTEPITEPATDPTEPVTDPPTDPTEPVTDPDLPVASRYGDVDCDGEISVNDIVALNMYLLDTNANIPNISQQGFANADVEKDGKIDLSDCAKLVNYLAEMIPESELGKASN